MRARIAEVTVARTEAAAAEEARRVGVRAAERSAAQQLQTAAAAERAARAEVAVAQAEAAEQARVASP